MGAENSKTKRQNKKEEIDYSPKNTYFASREGQKRDMKLVGQDVSQMLGFEIENSVFRYIGVYDGHGEKGRLAAEFVQKSIQEFFIKNKKEMKKWNSKEIISKKFTELSKSIQRNMLKDPDNFDQSGSCLISSLTIDKNCYAINIGDSRCVIGSKQAEIKCAIQMSVDHKPNDYDEEHRIRKFKGEVVNFKNGQYGPYRVYKEGENVPGLAVSRSLGDLVGHEVGVSEIPDVSVKILEEQDEFVVIGSDGIWDVMNSAEIVGFIFERIEKVSKEKIADEVVDECRKRWNVINKYKEDMHNEKEKKVTIENEIQLNNSSQGHNDKQLMPSPTHQNNGYDMKIGNSNNQNSGNVQSNLIHNNIDDITCVIYFFK